MSGSENLRLVGAEASGRALHGQSAYERLCDEIRSGALRPGARLLETEIADRLQISRTPVREAIRRLESEGLVDHQPRTGAVVRTLDYPEIMELYEMRAVLEGTAARLAARAASPVELEELKSINTEMAEATGDSKALVRLNRQFHARMMDAARNRFLLKSAETVEKTLLILGPSSMESPERAREAVEEHAAVLAALEARDGAAAEQAMRRHMERAQLTRLRMLRRAEGQED
ncbi:GntR family transcriptional regulator [Thetidibacter halocola]|uniref:GntR family transcriptional regulator n=1 Tax=Thetidibacter halocola TaxID=2827239 RepID=A0A8J7WEC0_9RHOB|nr:GntR family transcriptional regulator [Thetidibacter halocola]MBS0123806.1 GntR family transcriptional regulator [Thetidibacter halocola]